MHSPAIAALDYTIDLGITPMQRKLAITVPSASTGTLCPPAQWRSLTISRSRGLWILGATGGGATPRVLGRQLPLPPPPPGAFGQQLVAKGVALRRPWAPKAPDAT